MDFQHRRYDPPSGKKEKGRWQVHFAVDDVERAALVRAANGIIPAERFDIYSTTDDGAGDATASIYVDAEDGAGALRAGSSVLRKIRAAAGLPDAEVRPLGYISPWWKAGSLTAELEREASALWEQGRAELAIIRWHTACELEISATLKYLLAQHDPPVPSKPLIRRPPSLRDDTLALLQLLTGKRIQDEDWWISYTDHVNRRNAIVHAGVAVTKEDALESHRVAVALRTWLMAAREAARFDGDERDVVGDDADA